MFHAAKAMNLFITTFLERLVQNFTLFNTDLILDLIFDVIDPPFDECNTHFPDFCLHIASLP